MSAYTRELRDAIFHARNARRSLERAQAKAPEAHKPSLDKMIRAEGELIRGSVVAVKVAESKGGIRR